MRLAFFCSVLVLVGGCASSQSSSGASSAKDSEPTSLSGATSLESPALTCGAGASYQLVAETRCPDGSTPLDGDMQRGAHARLGSMGAHMEGTGPFDSHMVDHYLVPCDGGELHVYVCMYHCPEGRSPLD